MKRDIFGANDILHLMNNMKIASFENGQGMSYGIVVGESLIEASAGLRERLATVRAVLEAGALVELSALLMGWLRVGAGYNFSEISAGSVRCVEPGARGLFVRVETMY